MAHWLIFSPAIPDDLAAALDYYEDVSPQLANRFRTNIDQRLDDIAERPESFPTDVSPIRFAKIDRFPFLIFLVPKPNFISIIAIVHDAIASDRLQQTGG